MQTNQFQAQPIQLFDPNQLGKVSDPFALTLNPTHITIDPSTLNTLEPLSAPDTFAETSSRHGSVPVLEANLNNTEAQILVESSKTIADIYQASPKSFQELMVGLERAAQSGRVNFNLMTAGQRQHLASLGLDEKSSSTLIRQLFHMMKPLQDGQTTNAYQQIQQGLKSYFSGTSMQQRTIQQIESEAQDLIRTQQLLRELGGSGIRNLLDDKAAEHYDIAVSTVNSGNFKFHSAMDSTLSQILLASKQSPAKLGNLTHAIQNLQQSGSIDLSQRKVLSDFGLNVVDDPGGNGQLKVMDRGGQVVPADKLWKLFTVSSTYQNASPALQGVIDRGAMVIAQSGVVDDLRAKQFEQRQNVSTQNAAVNVQHQRVDEIRQQTVQTNQKVTELTEETQTLNQVLTSALTGLTSAFGAAAPAASSAAMSALATNQSFLSKYNVRVTGVISGDMEYFIGAMKASRSAVMLYLSNQLQQVNQELESTETVLASQKSEMLESMDDLLGMDSQLQTDSKELANTNQQLIVETDKLEDMEKDFEQYVAKETPNLTEEEKQVVNEDILPTVRKVVHTSVYQAREEIQATEQVLEEVALTHQKVMNLNQAVNTLALEVDENLEEAEEARQVSAPLIKQVEAAFDDGKDLDAPSLTPGTVDHEDNLSPTPIIPDQVLEEVNNDEAQLRNAKQAEVNLERQMANRTMETVLQQERLQRDYEEAKLAEQLELSQKEAQALEKQRSEAKQLAKQDDKEHQDLQENVEYSQEVHDKRFNA